MRGSADQRFHRPTETASVQACLSPEEKSKAWRHQKTYRMLQLLSDLF